MKWFTFLCACASSINTRTERKNSLPLTCQVVSLILRISGNILPFQYSHYTGHKYLFLCIESIPTKDFIGLPIITLPNQLIAPNRPATIQKTPSPISIDQLTLNHARHCLHTRSKLFETVCWH